jgi:peroxiredoxin
MPAMERVYRDYSQKGLIILAVNATSQDDPKDAIAFAEENDLTFPILLDLDGRASETYQIQALPSSFFIDTKGQIREVVIGGPMSEALIRVRVEQLLEETPP